MKDRKRRKAARLPWNAKKAAAKSAEKRKEIEEAEAFLGEVLRDEDLEGVAGGIDYVPARSNEKELWLSGLPS